MDNKQIATIFQQISNILEIKGENRFKILAYQRAAQVIESYPYDLNQIFKKNPAELLQIPGVGEALAQKIVELLMTGKLKYFDELLKNFNPGLLELLEIRGLGPKKVKLFYDELKIDNIAKLKTAAETEQLRTLPRMGPKSETDILQAIKEFTKHHSRVLLPDALMTAKRYLKYLEDAPSLKIATYAGSLRRFKETIGDIDLLAIGTEHAAIMEYFCAYNEVKNTLARGPTKSSVILNNGIQVDLRVLNEADFGAALLYFTGSKEHNVLIRERARKMGLKINEYGIFRGSKRIGGQTEAEIYRLIGLAFIPPELRENHGEVTAAKEHTLPKLIELTDLQGDLHVHTLWSDGSQSIKEVAAAAKKRGFKYLAITDHSQSLRIANGLDSKRIRDQWREIDSVKHELKEIVIFKGSEVDILPDGRLDFPDEILSQLDIVIGSVHSRFKLSRAVQTERVLTALKNPYLTILGHPSGRLLNEREPLDLDMEQVIKTAIKNQKILEINANPHRLDLNDYYIKFAKEQGAKFAINSDAHHSSNFENLMYGIFTARRGWIEKSNIVNALDSIPFPLKAGNF